MVCYEYLLGNVFVGIYDIDLEAGALRGLGI